MVIENKTGFSKFKGKESKEKKFYNIIKRLCDIIISLMGLVIIFPIVILFCIIVRIESRGRAIYSQERLGKNGKVFKIYKIRSMFSDAESEGAKWAERNDARVTKVGKFIRKTRIDELPQLWNTLKGDMSIVGPRPERPIFTEQFEKEIPMFKKRLLVRPGITGWAQINGGYEISAKKKLEYDLYYIEHRSLKMDVMIMFKTIKVIFTGEGAW